MANIDNQNIVLLGGEGFLGKGLQDELAFRNVKFKSIDKNDIDLSDLKNIAEVAYEIRNFSHVVVLASKIGIDIFESTPIQASAYNASIHQVVKSAIILAAMSRNCPFDVSYYSTSEVFGSLSSEDECICGETPYSFDFNNPRHLYSYVKFQAENDYLKINEQSPTIVSNVKILRPFNVYGKNQKRGVVYAMVKSALQKGIIRYRRDTTRTFTDIKLASSIAANAILCNNNTKVDLADGRNSLSLHSLAKIVEDVLGMRCKLVADDPDPSIQYRQVSKVDVDLDYSRSIMEPHILDIERQLENEA